ncbi:S8 family serine peptidase [Streptomyces sp. NPDC005481]|uniref:S8 family serine peptidase n=1 Tax=Streptomyces sp. NPDC005481 TaxID=3154881 RepID=UPI0033A3B4F0
MAWIRLSAAISTVLVVTLGSVSPASSSTEAEGTKEFTGTGQKAASATVRLLTGDRVTVTSVPGGRRTASVRPGPGREHVSFRTLEGDDKALTVLPSDAEALVTGGALDRRLFDVTGLIAQKYDEAHSSALPLIVSSQPSADGTARTARESRSAAATADRLTALNAPAGHARTLSSIDARSVRIAGKDLGRFWKTLNAPEGTDSARAAVAPHVFLDGRVRAVLDRSTAQINAPAAWKAGYEGQGVKVAVLDTGVDANHPDLTGRIAEARNFSTSAGTNDMFGHGTHVASTVGGTGAASSGTRRGVAPRADLLIGKVLGDDGYGSESAVVDGMEWAAGQHAEVVNMSLGSESPSDGTDPMSRAVNTLSASTGTLFVVAAGNAGEGGPATIGSPGAADAALTVGAVDRDDSLAPFSSRGPRSGDGAAKPDVTAPGVDIVAARAAGTAMGKPVDANYTASSGTSMATPHVAGAAALLAQQHPDWKAQQLKDALVSTSHTVPGTKVTEQGGGRVDLATAMGPVTATGSLTLPTLRAGDQDRTDAGTVHYANTGDRPLTLTLAVRLATPAGRALPEGAVRLGSGTAELAPGARTEVPLRVDASKAVRGEYYGYVTATSADGTVVAHTTLALVVRGKQHRLTVVYRGRDGRIVPGALPNIWGGSEGNGFVTYSDRDAAVAVVEEGTYHLTYSFYDENADGAEVGEIVSPDVKVTEDTTVTLDASDVTEVKIRTPRPAEQRGVLGDTFYRRIDGRGLIQGHLMFDLVKHLYVSRVAPVTDGTFEFHSRWQMVAPQLQARMPGDSPALTPYYEPESAVFDDRGAHLAAADAGTAEAPAFRGTRGKLAVIRVQSIAENTRELARKAHLAGAEALLMVWPENELPWTRWRPDGPRTAVPLMRISYTQGSALLKRVRERTTTVDFSGTVRSPYLYDVAQVSKGEIPANLVHTVSKRNSTVVQATYTRTGESAWASEQRFGWRPYQETAWNQHSRYVPVGMTRTEYVSSGDTLWKHTVHHDITDQPDDVLRLGMQDRPHTYRAGGTATERWFGAVVRPSIPRKAAWPSVREGDTLSVFVPEFTDSGAVHYSVAEAPYFGKADLATARLYRDGRQIAESGIGAWGDIEVPAGDAAYRLDLTTGRDSGDWAFGTRTHTSWAFRSDTTAQKSRLPLLQVDYDVPVDARNAVSRAKTHSLELAVRMQDGMASPQGVKVQVEASYDDGRTWVVATTTRKGHGFTSAVERPSRVRGDAYVTLRVTAKDADGNSVEQRVDRAYLHPGRR